MKIIGITGGVGSGKSRVLNELKVQYGAYIIEADKLAHELMEPGKVIYEEIVTAFGEDILCEEEPHVIDRVKLGKIVFSDKKHLDALNKIVHPLVKKSILMSIRQAKEKGDVRLFVIEAALLIEDEYKSICDELWYIWVDKETRIKRLMLQRNYTKEKSVSIMNNQSSDEFYKENCDFIIDNNRDYEYTSEQIKARLNTNQ
ncbi:MAG: dephospho-CoA kinase [Lachnospiraceae bacterium]|nr:dephospho-CoA kinase [Lachnospiraceae bacterium]